MHNMMASKITEKSKLRQIPQLHESRISDCCVILQLVICKGTVNKYICQLKTFSVSVKELLKIDELELGRIFNGGIPA